MKTILLLALTFFCVAVQLSAQTTTIASVQKDTAKALPANNVSDAVKDSIKQAKLEAMMSYPYIKSSKASGVLPVQGIEEKQDPALEYKLVFNVYYGDKDKMQKLNEGLAEVARTLNLHVAAGIPAAHIHAVVILSRLGLNTLLKEEVYKDKFNTSNPNIALIQELQNAGVKFISCGQSMVKTGIVKESMIGGIKVSLSARTAFSQYETMGYVEQ